MKKKYIVIIIIVICILIALIYGLTNKKYNNKLSGYNIIKDSVSNEKVWDEKSIIEQYTELEYNNSIYLNTDLKMNLENIDKEKHVTNIRVSEDSESMHKKQITIYSIKNISINYAIAIQFENDANYYVYINSKEADDSINYSTIYKYDKNTNTTTSIESIKKNEDGFSAGSEPIK